MLEPVKVDYNAAAKNGLKSILKIIAPLAVFALVVGIFFVVQIQREHREQSRVRVAILYDFDHLMAALEQNLPTLDIIYRQRGVEMLALGQEFRTTLADPENPIDFMLFWQKLRRDFFSYAHGIGHLNALTEGGRQWLLHEFHPRSNSLPTFQRYADILSVPPVFYTDMPLGWAGPRPGAEPNITFDIIEEGRIAHLRVRSLLWVDDSFADIRRIREFAFMVQNDGHIIIDLRGNGGGNPYFFHSNVGSMFVRKPQTVYIHNFYMAGSHNMEFMNSMGHMRPQSVPVDMEYIRGFVANEYLHVLDDIKRMDYHYIYAHTLEPGSLLVPFEGKIWMLVDEYMFSAAQWVATFYKEIGFATLVGNTTGGALAFCNIGMFSNYLTLPNSGIIVRYDTILSLDPRGRPIEYGTQPHYFNRPGMDALQTVLALIEEGWYR